MTILNYTTDISATKTASQIHEILVKAKANKVMNEYNRDGVITRISFMVTTVHGDLAVQLPLNAEGVLQALKRSKKVPASKRNIEQATRVAMRILKDWIEAQMAIIEAEMATLPQIFLPYSQTSTGETVYERFESNGMRALTYNPEGV